MMSWYFESSVAERLGLSRDEVEQYRARELRKKGDWKKIGRAIALSDVGLNKLLLATGASHVDCTDCLVGKNGADNGELVVVVARIYPNPRLLLARTTDGEIVRVSVRLNRNFRPGMKIKVEPPAGALPLYRLVGRCPRFPGKW